MGRRIDDAVDHLAGLAYQINNVDIVLYPRDWAWGAYVAVRFTAGALHDQNKVGLSHLTEHVALASIVHNQINSGLYNGQTQSDATYLYGWGEDSTIFLNSFFSLVEPTTWNFALVTSERQVMLAEAGPLSAVLTLRKRLHQAFWGEMFPFDGHFGVTAKDVARLTHKNVVAFAKRYYSAITAIVIAGRFDQGLILENIANKRNYLKQIARPPVMPPSIGMPCNVEYTSGLENLAHLIISFFFVPLWAHLAEQINSFNALAYLEWKMGHRGELHQRLASLNLPFRLSTCKDRLGNVFSVECILTCTRDVAQELFVEAIAWAHQVDPGAEVPPRWLALSQARQKVRSDQLDELAYLTLDLIEQDSTCLGSTNLAETQMHRTDQAWTFRYIHDLENSELG